MNTNANLVCTLRRVILLADANLQIVERLKNVPIRIIQILNSFRKNVIYAKIITCQMYAL